MTIQRQSWNTPKTQAHKYIRTGLKSTDENRHECITAHKQSNRPKTQEEKRGNKSVKRKKGGRTKEWKKGCRLPAQINTLSLLLLLFAVPISHPFSPVFLCLSFLPFVPLFSIPSALCVSDPPSLIPPSLHLSFVFLFLFRSHSVA